MLAFIEFKERSTLEDELERLKLDVWFAVTLAFIELSDRSTLDEELDKLRLDV